MEKLAIGLLALSMMFTIALILSAPIAFLIMLFLGNVGVHVSFWGSLPAAIALSFLKSVSVTKK